MSHEYVRTFKELVVSLMLTRTHCKTDCKGKIRLWPQKSQKIYIFWNETLYWQIDALIEDLGLDQVRHTKVSGLTTSEKRRLNVACHLLLDTDIVVLDQPTRGMDIFDTFFLVEFLRQWAATAGSNGPAAITPSGKFIVTATLLVGIGSFAAW
jgi:ABC-type branched-subunit amino acid transport system ATPase component